MIDFPENGSTVSNGVEEEHGTTSACVRGSTEARAEPCFVTVYRCVADTPYKREGKSLV